MAIRANRKRLAQLQDFRPQLVQSLNFGRPVVHRFTIRSLIMTFGIWDTDEVASRPLRCTVCRPNPKPIARENSSGNDFRTDLPREIDHLPSTWCNAGSSSGY